MKRRNSIRLFSAMAALQKGTTKTTTHARQELKQGSVFHYSSRSEGRRSQNDLAGHEYTRRVTILPGHSNSHLLKFSTAPSNSLKYHARTERTRDCRRFVKVPAESSSSARHIFLVEDATREEYKELIWLPVCGAVVDDPNLRKEGTSSASRGSSQQHFYFEGLEMLT